MATISSWQPSRWNWMPRLAGTTGIAAASQIVEVDGVEVDLVVDDIGPHMSFLVRHQQHGHRRRHPRHPRQARLEMMMESRQYHSLRRVDVDRDQTQGLWIRDQPDGTEFAFHGYLSCMFHRG